MTTYPIRLFGDQVLRRAARPVDRIDDALRTFAAALVETMLEAEGAGLAAPQVGVPLRLFVLAGSYAGTLDPEEEHDREQERAAARVVVNPEVLQRSGRRLDLEGCLSIPGIYAEVERDASITIRYQDLSGSWQQLTSDGPTAKAIQHEIDHLDGVLFLDRLAEPLRLQVMEEHRAELAQMQRDARAYQKERRQEGLPAQPWP